MKLWVFLVLSACIGHAADTAAALAKSFQNAGLDPQECYRVRDLSFQKDDLRVYLTEGHLIFSRSVEGRLFGAVFTTEVPGGDGEVILFPPTRSERLSLASFTKTPNLNEHIATSLFLFTDNTGTELLEQVRSASAKKAPEAGVLLDQALTPVLKNLASSYETRLVQDFMSAQRDELGFFYAALTGKTLGNFDVLYDPRGREQLMLGQVVFREDKRFFDTWTSFVSRPYRTGKKKRQTDAVVTIRHVAIDATLKADLSMNVVTRLTVRVNGDSDRAIPFDLSRRMKITEARVDGEPAEVFTRDAIRANLLRGDNDLFLVILPKQVQAGSEHTIEFHHEGNVVSPAGNSVYFVGSRSNWYPNRNAEFATYDLTFRYPQSVDLVATGEVVDDKTEGDQRITRRTTATPVRFAGFNIGEYDQVRVDRAGFRVHVVGNRKVEAALQQRPQDLMLIPPIQTGQAIRQGRRQPNPHLPSVMPPPPPNPMVRLQHLAAEIGSVMEFMSARFGPPPLSSLTVSPIPGTFGQGFPGLIYLSTLAYLDPAQRPPGLRTEQQRLFFFELLHAHEAAHQWWGNLVTSENYQDDWVMEALANYSSLMYLEKRKGRKALEDVLEEYRDNLMSRASDDKTLESSGPIIWGVRLNSSQTARSWRTIMYEKGSWIIHMLRMRMGDDAFNKMLAECVRRYRFKGFTSDNLRELASEFMPKNSEDPKLENFFEQWVYSTGIPALSMKYSSAGKAPKIQIRGTISQTGVPDDFSTWVPVEVQVPGRKAMTRWVRTSSDPVQFTVEVPRAPSKILLSPGQAVLISRN